MHPEIPGAAESERVLRLGVDELTQRYRDRQLSPVEVIDAAAKRIERIDPLLNAFVTLSIDRAREEAAEAERRFATRTARPLEGVPLAVKDLFDTAGIRTTYGSSIYAHHVPEADAAAVRLARDAGAVIVGKTGTHEFAWGITCENPHWGPVRNPWDPERVAGGSSGGSAAALAAAFATLALGSDTGGSIRIPAAFCGVTGLKPSYARISTAGVFPLAPSLDHVGPMARSPRDAWRLYTTIAGGAKGPPELPAAALASARIGLCSDPGEVAPSKAVAAALADCAAMARELGAEVVEISFPPAELVASTFATIQRAEARETHRSFGLFPGRSTDYGSDVRTRLEQASAIEPADYMTATATRARLGAAFADLFAELDLIMSPVSPIAAARIGESTTAHLGRDADFRSLVLGATMPQSLAGLPVCTIRAGFDPKGLPVGIQVTGPQGRDALVAAAAQALFEATDPVQQRWPDLDHDAGGFSPVSDAMPPESAPRAPLNPAEG